MFAGVSASGATDLFEMYRDEPGTFPSRPGVQPLCLYACSDVSWPLGTHYKQVGAWDPILQAYRVGRGTDDSPLDWVGRTARRVSETSIVTRVCKTKSHLQMRGANTGHACVLYIQPGSNKRRDTKRTHFTRRETSALRLASVCRVHVV